MSLLFNCLVVSGAKNHVSVPFEFLRTIAISMCRPFSIHPTHRHAGTNPILDE